MSTQPVTSGRRSVQEFMLRAFAAWETLSVENLPPFFRMAPQDRFFHLYSTNYHKWDSYKSHCEQFMNEHSALNIRVTDTRIYAEAELVYSAFCYEMEESLKNGKRSTREGRYTGVLLPSGDSWLIVHEQWSLPVRAAGWENY